MIQTSPPPRQGRGDRWWRAWDEAASHWLAVFAMRWGVKSLWSRRGIYRFLKRTMAMLTRVTCRRVVVVILMVILIHSGIIWSSLPILQGRFSCIRTGSTVAARAFRLQASQEPPQPYPGRYCLWEAGPPPTLPSVGEDDQPRPESVLTRGTFHRLVVALITRLMTRPSEIFCPREACVMHSSSTHSPLHFSSSSSHASCGPRADDDDLS